MNDPERRTHSVVPDAPHAPAVPALPDEPYYRHAHERPRFDTRLLIGVALVVLGLVLLSRSLLPMPNLFGSIGGSERVVIEETFAASAIRVDAGSADVIIEPAGGDQAWVRATQRGGGAGDFAVQINRDGDLVRLSHSATPCLFFCARDLTYRIGLPATAEAEVGTLSGDVTLAGAARDVRITTASGDVALNAPGGPVQVGTISGDVAINNAQSEEIQINTTSGRIVVEGGRGSLMLQTVSGDVDVQHVQAGLLQISSTSGDIEYDGELTRGSHRLSSVSGDIDLRLPATSDLQINASTVSGRIRSAFDSDTNSAEQRNWSGMIGNGAGRLTLETISGDITIDRR
ncbi:MAG TPA: DUF4097 family beta strand repeat-containing protein [Roseiflexaceae bacterium]|nr:DUF4097 family beta strand repeat-containing protein [Roseiflexaceae bacterium]HMP42332.1 DUF4097 family beta strand repeat-containing protein [Roseiflexaceae bacterium]